MRLPTRHPDWEPRLLACAEAWREREYAFVWGSDCVAFVLDAIEAVTGEQLTFDGARPYRSPAGQGRWLKDMGWADLPTAADACFGERIPVLAAHRGDIVSDGSILGVKVDARTALAFSEDGVVPFAASMAWPVGRVS